ncbi:MAG TPA: ABC transporter permease [Thermoanaerobaculia bacterium]|nr:ABC transporter permease [Thermoanaerobaculia bacterium]
MDGLRQDLRYGLRALSQRPGYTAAAVLTLALGLGASTAIWSVAEAVLLRPLPFPRADRLVELQATHPRRGAERVAITPADFLAWRSAGTSFEHLGAYVPFGTLDLTGGGEPERLSRHLVSEGLLEALGVRAARGRLFTRDEYGATAERAVVLADGFWRRRFGADPAVVGRRLRLGGELYAVVGVLPAGFRIIGGSPDLLVPLVFGPAAASDRESGSLGAIGRLRPGVRLRQARAELEAVSARLARQFPATNEDLQASLLPLRQVFAGAAPAALAVLLGAVGFLLLIACANVAGLERVRAVSREREIVVRAALGAGWRRLLRLLLVESLLLSALGGALGLALAALALRLLPDARGVYLPRDLALGIDAGACGFALVLTLLTGLAAGLAPALLASRVDLAASLRSRSGAARAGRRGAPDLLVIPQVALAFVLLVGAALLGRGFLRLATADPGFEPRRLLTLEVALPAARYPAAGSAAAFYSQLLERIGGLPGVVAAGAAKEIPPEEPWGFSPAVDGRQPAPEDAAGWQVVTPGYFAAMGTPVLRGRPFTAADRSGSRRVMIASESAARRFLSGGDPLGRRVRFNHEEYEIVGVVRDQLIPRAAPRPEPVFYVAHAQAPVPAGFLRAMTLAVRTAGDPRQAAAGVRAALRELDREIPAVKLQAMEQRLAGGLLFARSRFNTVLLGLFAGLALALAAVGIYGMLSYLVSRRAPELGVRMALGAGRGDLFRMVIRRGLSLTLVGLGVGLAGARALSGFLSGLLYGIESADPLTYALVPPAFLAVALLACYLPARRAAGLDPSTVLKQE